MVHCYEFIDRNTRKSVSLWTVYNEFLALIKPGTQDNNNSHWSMLINTGFIRYSQQANNYYANPTVDAPLAACIDVILVERYEFRVWVE
jgi:hypothetical protein